MDTRARRASSFFYNDTATTEIYTLSLHDALPIWKGRHGGRVPGARLDARARRGDQGAAPRRGAGRADRAPLPAGGENRRQARPPEHHSDLPRRERRRTELLRDEIRLRHVARGPARPEAAAPRARDSTDPVGGGIRTGPRPPACRGAPRREARQHHVRPDRKSTRLNSSHSQISYAVFCLKKKKSKQTL